MKHPWLSPPRLSARTAGTIAFLAAAALLFILLAAAQGPPPVPAAEVNSLEGAAIYKQHCATCHGMDARGHGPMSMALKARTPDLTRIAQRNGGKFPSRRVRTTIEGASADASAHGNREMPVWGPIFHEIEWDRDLGNVRIENLTRYLESLQQK
ncbi:MAG TPA: cytochrome c [Terriglobales bacterium]